MTGYTRKVISINEKDRLLQKYADHLIFERKADINGCCIRLWTDNEEFKHSWEENWYFMSETVRSHGRLMAISSGDIGIPAKGKKPRVFYDPLSCSAFLFDCDYYGWVKSAALALAGDILEDNHDYFSIHGACLDVGGKGTTIIGPSGTGKTTLAYGMLMYKDAKLVSDDWHFFKFWGESIIGYSSEKNTYIRADLASSWPEYSGIFKVAKIDKEGRSVLDVGRVIGRGGMRRTTEIKNVVLLRREKGKEIIKKLSTAEAMGYMEKNDYCNPHLLQHNAWKKKLWRKSFMRLFKNANVYLLNTIETPRESLERVCKIAGLESKEKRKIKV